MATNALPNQPQPQVTQPSPQPTPQPAVAAPQPDAAGQQTSSTSTPTSAPGTAAVPTPTATPAPAPAPIHATSVFNAPAPVPAPAPAPAPIPATSVFNAPPTPTVLVAIPTDPTKSAQPPAAVNLAVLASITTRYMVRKHSWRGKYNRLFCLTNTSVVTLNPSTLEVTNTWEYKDIISLVPSVKV